MSGSSETSVNSFSAKDFSTARVALSLSAVRRRTGACPETRPVKTKHGLEEMLFSTEKPGIIP